MSKLAFLAAALLQTSRSPLPAEPPLEGPFWTVVVPAILLLIATVGTWMLWRHFANED